MFRVTINQALLDLFWRRRVFHHLQRERWQVGETLLVPEICALEPFSQILAGTMLPRRIGAFSYARSPLVPSAEIGRYCSIASSVAAMGSDHPLEWASTSPAFHDPSALGFAAFLKMRGLEPIPRSFPITPPGFTVGNDVWIGDDVLIAPGVAIGDGAVVGARSLVLKDVPPYAIAVGHPAKVLRMRFPEPLIERFLEVRWWRYGPDVLQDLPVEAPARFLDALEERIAAEAPSEFVGKPLETAEIVAAAEATEE
jgi:acetyltransferase-like isoleucine patch superfamily enzyme